MIGWVSVYVWGVVKIGPDLKKEPNIFLISRESNNFFFSREWLRWFLDHFLCSELNFFYSFEWKIGMRLSLPILHTHTNLDDFFSFFPLQNSSLHLIFNIETTSCIDTIVREVGRFTIACWLQWLLYRWGCQVGG